jgi:putative NADPH-quinone reductase
MIKKIAIIDAHPDPDPTRFLHALVEAYSNGARAAGHDVRIFRLADIDVPLLRTREIWMTSTAPASVVPGQEMIQWAEHVVFFYPLWLGDMPAILKAFLEQILRPGFALDYGDSAYPKKMLQGRSARLVVTMGMPAFFYRAFYGAHSVRSFRRNILQLTGFDPVDSSIIGNVEGSPKHREVWLKKITDLGAAAK